MARVIVLEDAWDGPFILSSACHQAGHQVLAIQHPSVLLSTLRGNAVDALVVDTAIPGVCMSGIDAMAAEAGLPVVATGYSPWSPVRGLAAFVPKAAPPGRLVEVLDRILDASAVSRAAWSRTSTTAPPPTARASRTGLFAPPEIVRRERGPYRRTVPTDVRFHAPTP